MNDIRFFIITIIISLLEAFVFILIFNTNRKTFNGFDLRERYESKFKDSPDDKTSIFPNRRPNFFYSLLFFFIVPVLFVILSLTILKTDFITPILALLIGIIFAFFYELTFYRLNEWIHNLNSFLSYELLYSFILFCFSIFSISVSALIMYNKYPDYFGGDKSGMFYLLIFWLTFFSYLLIHRFYFLIIFLSRLNTIFKSNHISFGIIKGNGDTKKKMSTDKKKLPFCILLPKEIYKTEVDMVHRNTYKFFNMRSYDEGLNLEEFFSRLIKNNGIEFIDIEKKECFFCFANNLSNCEFSVGINFRIFSNAFYIPVDFHLKIKDFNYLVANHLELKIVITT